jgi:hypothetical protein
VRDYNFGTQTVAVFIYEDQAPYLGARYRRLAARRGKSKAVVAIQHSILVTIWSMAQTGALYDDLAPTTTPASRPPDQPPRHPPTPRTRLHRHTSARELSCHLGNLRVSQSVRRASRATLCAPIWIHA